MQTLYYTEQQKLDGYSYRISDRASQESQSFKFDVQELMEWIDIFARQSKSFVMVDVGDHYRVYHKGVRRDL